MFTMFQQARCDRATFLNIIMGIGIIFGIAIAAAVLEGICLLIAMGVAENSFSCQKYCPELDDGGGFKRDVSNETFTPFPTTTQPNCVGGNNSYEAACDHVQNEAFYVGVRVGIALIALGLLLAAGITVACFRRKARADADREAVRLDEVVGEDKPLVERRR